MRFIRELNHRLCSAPAMAALLALALSTGGLAASNSSEGGSNQAVGGDRTAQGCIKSAGYTWSQVLSKCIRLFEVGVPLYNVQDPTATDVAYVVNGGEQLPLELFLPDKDAGILMYYSDGGWQDDDHRYTLTNDANDVLEVRNGEGTLMFSSRKPEG